MQAQPESAEHLTGYYTEAFGFDVPLWKQYLNFWAALFQGDLGTSIANYPIPVSELILGALPYTLALLVPAILLSFWAGNKVGALAARRKVLDNTVLPVGYVLTATPQMWLGIVLAWVFATDPRLVPGHGRLQPGVAAGVVDRVRRELPLPLDSPVLDALPRRVRRVGDRDAEHDHLRARGRLLELPRRARRTDEARPEVRVPKRAPPAGDRPRARTRRRRRRRDRRGDRLLLPGLGTLTLTAIQNRDYFLIQGIFLFLIIGVLIANFIIDIAYVFIDPRTRIGMQGGA